MTGHCSLTVFMFYVLNSHTCSFLSPQIQVFGLIGEPHCTGCLCPVHSPHFLPVLLPWVPSPFPTTDQSLLYNFSSSSIRCDTDMIFSSTKSMFHNQIIKQFIRKFHLFVYINKHVLREGLCGGQRLALVIFSHAIKPMFHN